MISWKGFLQGNYLKESILVLRLYSRDEDEWIRIDTEWVNGVSSLVHDSLSSTETQPRFFFRTRMNEEWPRG